MLLVGTADGLLDLALDGTEERRALEGANVVAAVDGWAIADDTVVSLDSGAPAELPEGLAPRCLLALDGGRALVGTSDARLLVVGGPEGTREDALFDDIPSRDEWSTPWGGPPDTRSLALDGKSGPYVGVHVGGVWRRDADEWVEIVPARADDHQVVCTGDTVVVAAGIGVGQSSDRGETWHWSDDGLHGRYSRAVAVADDWLLAGASTGPATTEAALYRRPLGDPEAPFARRSTTTSTRSSSPPPARWRRSGHRPASSTCPTTPVTRGAASPTPCPASTASASRPETPVRPRGCPSSRGPSCSRRGPRRAGTGPPP
jgi:hypothetical protein